MISALRMLPKRAGLTANTVSDLVWALRWLGLYQSGRATWADLKSYRYRYRTGNDQQHRRDRIVDDVQAVKKLRNVGRAALQSAMREDVQRQRDYKQGAPVPDLSFILPFGDMRGDRYKLLIASLGRLIDLFPGSEIIISDLAGTLRQWSKEGEIPASVRVIQGDADAKDFNVALAVNSGVKAASYNTLCILQADILVPQSLPCAAGEFYHSSADYWFPAKGVFFLDQASTERVLQMNDSSSAALCPGSYCRELESYCLFIKRDVFEYMGGYFAGYTQSAEDNDFYDRLEGLQTKPRTIPLFHLWHPPYWRMAIDIMRRNQSLLSQQRRISMAERIIQARAKYSSE